MSVLALLPGIFAGAASIWNAFQQKKQQDWQIQAQKTTWKREDTAQQRAVTDLKNAGLSPTLAAGHPAPTSAPTKPEAPKMDAFALMNMLKMKADISKTEAETRVLSTTAHIAERTIEPKVQSEFSIAEYNKLRVQLNQLDITEKTVNNRIAILKEKGMQHYENQMYVKYLAMNQLLNEKTYNYDRSREMGVRTHDTGNVAQVSGQVQALLMDLINKLSGGTVK